MYEGHDRADNAADGERGVMTEKQRPNLRSLGKQDPSTGKRAEAAKPEQLQLQLPVLIDIPTLARRLGTSDRHVRRLVAEKRIPYLKVGHLVRFDVVEVAEWLQANRHRPSGPALASGQ